MASEHYLYITTGPRAAPQWSCPLGHNETGKGSRGLPVDTAMGYDRGPATGHAVV